MYNWLKAAIKPKEAVEEDPPMHRVLAEYETRLLMGRIAAVWKPQALDHMKRSNELRNYEPVACHTRNAEGVALFRSYMRLIDSVIFINTVNADTGLSIVVAVQSDENSPLGVTVVVDVNTSDFPVDMPKHTDALIEHYAYMVGWIEDWLTEYDKRQHKEAGGAANDEQRVLFFPKQKGKFKNIKQRENSHDDNN